MLCDVFERFIKTCLDYYSSDLCHYFSSPGLSWDEMLKMTGIKLEKINDIDMHLFTDDANNLYDWAMIQPLPVSDFKLLTKKEINKFNLDSISENSEIGYTLEVDLKYPKELHNLHNDYPLCLEKKEVSSDMLLRYCNNNANKFGIKAGGVKKLIPNLGDKVKYVVHYRNLQYYLSLGMKLIKVHGILKFKQSNWLKEYIEFNTKKRQESIDEFNKAFGVYGKSTENITKRINVRLVNDLKEYLKCVS